MDRREWLKSAGLVFLGASLRGVMTSDATLSGPKVFRNPDPAVVDAHVDAILQRMHSVDWGGISLDIEIGSMRPEHVDAMQMFVDQKYVTDTMKWAFEGLALQRHQVQIGYQIDPQPQATKNPPGIQSESSVVGLIRGPMREHACGLVMWGLFGNSTAAMARFPRFADAYWRKGP